MSTTPLQLTVVPRGHRLRRWIIRISLPLLLLTLTLAVAGFLLLGPTGLTADEAEAVFAQLKKAGSRENAEHLLGKPHSEVTEHGATTLSWQFYTHGLMRVDVFHCTVSWDQQGVGRSSNSIKVKIEGGEAWRWRWNKLRQRLGMK